MREKLGPFAQVALANALREAGKVTIQEWMDKAFHRLPDERVTKDELAQMPVSGVTH